MVNFKVVTKANLAGVVEIDNDFDITARGKGESSRRKRQTYAVGNRFKLNWLLLCLAVWPSNM